ncbi:MAG: cytochrome c3 family protein [Dissulfuribacterales bacterium]
MNKKGKLFFLLLIISGIVMIFLATGINAKEKASIPGVIEMKNTDAFKKHKKSIVMFDHQKHSAAKPDGYELGCGDCHHDKEHKPLNDLKAGDKVQDCFECHNKPEKPKKPKGMSKDDWKKLQVEYYYGAIHESCKECHKKVGAGPVKCAECHPKAKK